MNKIISVILGIFLIGCGNSNEETNSTTSTKSNIENAEINYCVNVKTLGNVINVAVTDDNDNKEITITIPKKS